MVMIWYIFVELADGPGLTKMVVQMSMETSWNGGSGTDLSGGTWFLSGGIMDEGDVDLLAKMAKEIIEEYQRQQMDAIEEAWGE